MYRRIEIINGDIKGGLCCMVYDGPAQDEWLPRLKGVRTGKNNRYYFTEKGWREVGKQVASRLNEVGQQFRVIKIKEKSVDVMAENDLEVAVRARKKR